MAVHVLKAGSRPPWVGLAAAVWMQIAAGNGYNFPLYSSTLKLVLGLNQRHLTILGVANDLGENVGILPGIASNKFPPWILLSIGAASSFLGYGVLWLAATGTVQNLPYWLLWIALCIGANSNSWFGTAVLVTNMRNFPLSRGTVAGILKGYIGISAAVYTEIFSLALKNSAPRLLLFLALGLPIVAFLTMYLIRPCTPASVDDETDNSHFVFTQTVSVVLAVYLLTTTIISVSVPLKTAVCYTLVGIMVVLLLSPLAIPLKMTIYPSKRRRSETPATDSGDQPLLTPSSSAAYLEDSTDLGLLIAEGEGAVRKKRRPRRGEDFTFSQAFVKADFWLLWTSYFLGTGAGVTVLNNLAQIGAALGVNDTTILLSIFSFCNFAGRLGSGILSEYFVRLKTTPRTVWIALSQVVMVIIFVMYATALDGTLYAATALLGVCYGVQFSIMVPTVSEIFGLRHFGIIYNFMQLGNPIGAVIFSVFLAGSVYDAEASKQGSATCVGRNCYRLTFTVLAGVSAVSVVLSAVVTKRVAPVYQALYAGGSFRLPLPVDSNSGTVPFVPDSADRKVKETQIC